MTTSSKASPVYLLPGIYGEKSDFAAFLSCLPEKVPVEIVELQSLEEPVAQLTDMRAIGMALAREIDRRSPEGSLRLAGYSFGATVAFEAARCLVKSGRSICFLGIIDGVIRPRRQAHRHQNDSWGGRLLQLFGNINASTHEGLFGLVYRLLRFAYRVMRELSGRFCSSDLRLSHVRSLLHQLSPTSAAFVRRMLLFYFRMKAMESWQPLPIKGSVFLAISEEYSSWIDCWYSLCPQGRVTRLPGEHVRVLEPPSVALLCSAFAEAVQSAETRGTTAELNDRYSICIGAS